MNRRSWVVLAAVAVFGGLLAYTLWGGGSGGDLATLTPEAFWREDRNSVGWLEVERDDGSRLVLERVTREPDPVAYEVPQRFRGRVAAPFTTFTPPGPDTEWWIAEPVRVPADPSTVASLLITLAEPRPLQQVAGEGSEAPDLRGFGLDPPRAVVRVGVDRGEGEPVVRELHVGDATPLRSSTGEPQSYYVAVPGVDRVHTLSSYPLESIFQGVDGLRLMQFARFEPDRAVAMRLLWDEKPAVELVRDGEGWRLEGPDRIAADRAAVQDLLYDLDLLRAEEVVRENATDEDLAEYGLDNPRGEVVVRLEADPDAAGSGGSGEEVPGRPRAQVLWVGDFLSDGSGVYVRLASDRTVYRVRGDRLQPFFDVTARPARLARRNLLPEGWEAGPEGTLQRLTWERDGTVTVAQRGSDGSWSGVEDPEALLDAIEGFRAEEGVATGAEAEEAARWSPGETLPEGAEQLTLEPEPGSQPAEPVVVTRLPGEEAGRVRLLWAWGDERLLLRADPEEWQSITEHW